MCRYELIVFILWRVSKSVFHWTLEIIKVLECELMKWMDGWMYGLLSLSADRLGLYT